MFQPLPFISSRRHISLCASVLLLVLSFFSCTGPKEKMKTSRAIVMTTELVRDSSIYRLYDSLHSKEGVWPELKKANLASGIKSIMIYRYDNRLMMILELSEHADLSKMDSLYVNADKKIRIWGEMMSGFQRALPGVDTSKKWVEMELIHHYQDGEYLK